MTDRTERHQAAPHRDLSGEGQKGMTKVGSDMTERTERRLSTVGEGRDRVGQSQEEAA